MLNYEYRDNNEGGKTLTINRDNKIIVMILHESVEGHTDLLDMFKNEEKLERYVLYLAENPNREFNLTEIKEL